MSRGTRVLRPLDLDRLDRWAYLLDGVFRVPGTRIRFGWDPILGLVPVVGDLTSPIFSLLLLLYGVLLRLPKIVLIRMALNALIDAALGAVPVVGDVLDVFWPANEMNLGLLRRHAHAAGQPRWRDYAFLYAIALLALASILVPIAASVWAIAWLARVL